VLPQVVLLRQLAGQLPLHLEQLYLQVVLVQLEQLQQTVEVAVVVQQVIQEVQVVLVVQLVT
jgi:hypothetical protein